LKGLGTSLISISQFQVGNEYLLSIDNETILGYVKLKENCRYIIIKGQDKYYKLSMEYEGNNSPKKNGNYTPRATISNLYLNLDKLK